MAILLEMFLSAIIGGCTVKFIDAAVNLHRINAHLRIMVATDRALREETHPDVKPNSLY